METFDTPASTNLDYLDTTDITAVDQYNMGQNPPLSSAAYGFGWPTFVSPEQSIASNTHMSNQAAVPDPRSLSRDLTASVNRQTASMQTYPASPRGFWGDPVGQQTMNIGHPEPSHRHASQSSLSTNASSYGHFPHILSPTSSSAYARPTMQLSPQSAPSSALSRDAEAEVSDHQQGFGYNFDNFLPVGSEQYSMDKSASPVKEEDSIRGSLTADGRDALSDSVGEVARTARDSVDPRAGSQMPVGEPSGQAHTNVDKVSGWGWRTRGVNEPSPAFGDTDEIIPIFNEHGQHVPTTLHGSFHFSRGQKGQVSDDGGEMVHELQKRNIFHIKDIHYTLTPSRGVPTYLTVEHNDILRRVHSLSMRLKGRDFDGDQVRSRETPLESRGKAREFTTAREWNETVTMRPREDDDLFANTQFFGDGVAGSLPDTFSAMHLEFRHATSGNKTIGVWRLPGQHYYRLVIQLCAKLQGTHEVVVVAETSSELLLVRGRPPGGRELARMNASESPMMPASEIAETRFDRQPKRKQKRTKRTKQEDEEDDWVDDANRVTSLASRRVGTEEWHLSQGARTRTEGGPTPRVYNTRNARKRTYKESEAEESLTDDADGEHEADDDSWDLFEEEHRCNRDDDPEDIPTGESRPENRSHGQYSLEDASPKLLDTPMNDRYEDGLQGHEGQQVHKTNPSMPENESDSLKDSLIDDPMDVDAFGDFFPRGEFPVSPMSTPHPSDFGTLDFDDPQYLATDFMYPQQDTSFGSPGASDEPPQSPRLHSQQRSTSQVPTSVLSFDTMLLFSDRASLSSSAARSDQGQDDQTHQMNWLMRAGGMSETLAPPDPEVFGSFTETAAFAPFYNGHRW